MKKQSIIALLCLPVLASVLLMLPPQPAQAAETAATRTALRDLAALRSRVMDLLDELEGENSLSSSELNQLRNELEGIYDDLRSVERGLGAADDGPSQPGSDWMPYTKAKVDVLPRNASFKGWQTGNSMVIRIGGDEDIYLTVTNGNYTAETELPDAYQGAVKTKATADPGGWVILSVSDMNGTREFKIANGGLGPVSVRSTGGKTTSPVQPGDSTGTAPSGKWDAKYANLVHGGQMKASASMEWLRQQVAERDYASDALRDLGEYLRQMEGESAHERVGVLRWFSGQSEKKLDIPDPRVDALSFVNVLNNIYALDSSDDWYRIDMDY